MSSTLYNYSESQIVYGIFQNFFWTLFYSLITLLKISDGASEVEKLIAILQDNEQWNNRNALCWFLYICLTYKSINIQKHRLLSSSGCFLQITRALPRTGTVTLSCSGCVTVKLRPVSCGVLLDVPLVCVLWDFTIQVELSSSIILINTNHLICQPQLSLYPSSLIIEFYK